MSKKIAFLVPCYNESKTIEKVVKDCKKAIPEATVYVYDNNSTDGTDEIAKKAGAVVRYEYQQGKGNVIRRMFREIEAGHCSFPCQRPWNFFHQPVLKAFFQGIVQEQRK